MESQTPIGLTLAGIVGGATAFLHPGSPTASQIVLTVFAAGWLTYRLLPWKLASSVSLLKYPPVGFLNGFFIAFLWFGFEGRAFGNVLTLSTGYGLAAGVLSVFLFAFWNIGS